MQTAPGDRRDWIVGRVLEGRYRVIERLARGGMSTVYRALDERLDRPVAVKVMSAALSSDPAFADRFAREARVAARLSHLNAVSVYDQGTDGEHVFLVMELVSGRTLRDLIRERGVLSPAQAVSIMEPVLGALAAAHRAGLVHRDVKPENILLSDDGVVKVADFGLARAIESDASSTRTGLMMGTVAYCPPEQISRGAADARSDVYSSGVMLFEMLTGSTPYVGDSAMAVAYQHVNSDVPAPSSRRAGVPHQLDDLVMRAASREPSGRPLDAGALLAELHDTRMDLGLPVVAVPPRRTTTADLSDTQRIDRVPEAGRPAHPSMPPGPRLPPPDDRSRSAEAPTAPTHGTEFRGGADQHTAIQQRATSGRRPAGPSAGSGPAGSGPAGSGLAGSGPAGSGPAGSGLAGSGPTGSGAGSAAAEGRRRGKRPPSRRRRARRRMVLALVLILLLGLLTGYGAWYLAVGRYHQVPNLTGQLQSVAAQNLRNSGFKVDPAPDQAYSETVAAGTVVATNPVAGTHLLGGKSVQLVVSRGAERYTVPAIVGQTYNQAKQAFSGMPVQVERTDIPDDTGKIAAGSVIRTDPVASTKIKRDSTVTVYVSSGPPLVSVPNVTGKTQDDATTILTQAAFKITTSQDYSEQVPVGSVISQDPQQGASVSKFSTVHLVISKGPPLVTLPSISNGTSADDARKTLEGLRLKVKIKRAFGGFLNEVVGMDPKGGTEVPVGSEVTLTVV